MSKLSFRARTLDVTKQMPVYVADELPDLGEYAAINRAVAQMPTGMEKDEEMELHLQEAIIAQQECNSGVTQRENHVIPTPKVDTIDARLYDRLYPQQPAPSKNQLIKVQAALTIDKERPEYDLDSEDDEWLRTKPHITADEFEQIMDLLEGASSDNQICQPKEARALLSSFDDQLVDDVYDYWLQKRKSAAQSSVQSLIARIKSDTRRDTNSSAAVNPYVAFRRRAEKMQTRKNRKNDEESYEKILKLSHDLRKAVTLFEMVKRREKSKLALINLDEEIIDRRVVLDDFNGEIFSQLVHRVKPEFQFASSKEIFEKKERTTASHKRRKNSRATVSALDKDLVSHAWLKQNAEDWNRPSCVFSSSSPIRSSSNGGRVSAKDSPDGRFTFKRRRGCAYRAAIEPSTSATIDDVDLSTAVVDGDFNRTFLPCRAASGLLRCIGMARQRVGRGGRLVFDRLTGALPDRIDSCTAAIPSSSIEEKLSDRIATSAPSSNRELYFRPRTPLTADDANDDDRNDQMIESSYSADIPIGISDRMYPSHRCGLALGEFDPAEAVRGDRDDDDPLQLCAISATSAVTTDAGVMQLIAQRGYARVRTTNPIAVVAANQHPANNYALGSVNHHHKPPNSNGHGGQPARKRSLLNTDPSPAVQALNYPSATNSFAVSPSLGHIIKQKAVVSPMSASITSVDDQVSIAATDSINKLSSIQESLDDTPPSSTAVAVMSATTNGDLDHASSRQQVVTRTPVR